MDFLALMLAFELFCCLFELNMVTEREVLDCIKNKNFQSIERTLGYEISEINSEGVNNEVLNDIFYFSIRYGQNTQEYIEFFKNHFSNYQLNDIFSFPFYPGPFFPLLGACISRNYELVKYMIESGVDLNSNKLNLDVLDKVIRFFPDRDIAILLISHGARLSERHLHSLMEVVGELEKKNYLKRHQDLVLRHFEQQRALLNFWTEHRWPIIRSWARALTAIRNDKLSSLLKECSVDERINLVNDLKNDIYSMLNTILNIACIVLVIPALVSLLVYGMALLCENFNLIEQQPRNPFMFFNFGSSQQIEESLSRLNFVG